MREWVIPLLRSIRPVQISEEAFERELEQVPFLWRRVADLFLHEFGSDGMAEVVGSVIAEMPKSDFDKLFKMNLFFILAKSPGFCQKLHANGDVTIIVFCQSDLAPMTWAQRRGTVAHEIAHSILNHLDVPFSLDDPWREKQQAEADALVRQWGMREEIDSVLKYLSIERRDGNGRD